MNLRPSALAAIALMIFTGCPSNTNGGATQGASAPLIASAPPRQADPQAAVSGTFAGALNDFGVGLLRGTLAGASGNVVVSPASVHAALSLTVNGATDETGRQMRRVLRTEGMSPAEANRQWASLLQQLGTRSPEQVLALANSLWARKGVAFRQAFLDADRDCFGAEVATLDFAKADVAGAINGWVSRNTGGMIDRIVDKVPGNAVLYLVNAVYFKGAWNSPFEPKRTRPTPFTRGDGSRTEVQMMQATRRLPYVETGALQAARLAYKGGDSACYILLPAPGQSLDAALASLAGTGFPELRERMARETEIMLGLPRLDAEFAVDLATPLAALGMPRAFDPQLAEFSGIAETDQPIYISRVLHKTKVKVDEKGTEAAAATAVEMGVTSVGPGGAPPVMVCDRPYLFAIVDEASGVMLFLGAVRDPS